MKRVYFVLIAAIFTLNSCEDNDSNPGLENNSALESIDEYAMVSQIFQDIGNTSGDVIMSAESISTENKAAGKYKSESSAKGPEITVSPADFHTFPKTISIDFGTGVLGEDGITRKGLVKIVSTGWYRNKGSEHTTTFSNFYHESYQVEGTHIVKNLGADETENLRFSVRIDDGRITDVDGDNIEYTEESFRTWIAGYNTPLYIWDDQYLLEGEQSGKSSKGVTYQLNIQEALHFVVLPRSIQAGIVKLDIGRLKDIILNFNDSTVTILGISYPFKNEIE